MQPGTDIEQVLASFDIAWNLGFYEEGLKIYNDNGKPFGLSADVAIYLESRGRFCESLEAWRHMVDSYFGFGERLLPFIDHSNEIFLLGAWDSSTDKFRARRYLMEYVRVARKYGNKPGFHLPYKTQALRLLYQLRKPEQKDSAAGGKDGR